MPVAEAFCKSAAKMQIAENKALIFGLKIASECKKYAAVGKFCSISKLLAIFGPNFCSDTRQVNKSPRLIYMKRNYYQEHRSKVFDMLGRQCVKCGFDDIRALQIDHIHGGGNQHKETIWSYLFVEHIA